MKLDPIDLRILAALQAEGRITKLTLSEKVNLSPSACFERLRRLEQAGYIKGYHADIDLNRIVKTTTALVEVTLGRHETTDFTHFEQAIAAAPEVLECYSIGGGIDYILKVVVVDIDHYQAVIDRLLSADLGIAKYFTYFVTKPVKRQLAYPLHSYLDAAQDR